MAHSRLGDVVTWCSLVETNKRFRRKCFHLSDEGVSYGEKKLKRLKNVDFWDIKTQFVLHRRHVTSPLQSPAS
jgi:hypothetical protein